ncbi:MAG: M4 family metallopeptidase, partial [Eggerthellaceae bacterium]|nr:M4 family metallopeptidase [Eggerthellaceae bacterium]
MAEEKARAELSHIHTHRNLIGFDENGVSIVTHEAAHLDGADEEERQRAFVKDYNEAVKAYRKTFPTKQDQIDATPDPAVRDMLLRSEQLGFDTAFDRFDAQQPQCNFGLSGTCCRICNMGPCRVTAKAPRGVCGADADLIVARNMLRSAAAGVAQHGMHAREVILSLKWAAEGKLDLPILGEQKIRSVAAAFGIRTERRQLKNIAADLADALLDDLSRSDPHEPYRTIGAMAPPERRKVWEELDILPVSAYHEVFDAQHRSGCATDGQASAEIVPDATRQTLIALSDESQALRYAWVVHTDNYLPDFDAGYLAHYVSADGEYLYAIPVSEPGDDESLAGEAAAFPFDKLEKSTWSGTVTKHDGTTVEVSVPTLVDPDTGDVFLADGERKILCTDFADYTYNDTISPRVQTDGRFADNEILIYDSFIKVWDCYKETGWTGPDGDGTPSLLKMDMADKDGNVIRNACYTGRNAGFQTFAFNREDADGECVDIIGHEFTHCVTSALMTSTIYMNDSGAINEGMSDILGNLIEMEVAYDQDGAWLIGENEGIPLRSMKDPHDRHQPEFTWDAYYGPAVAEGSDAHDNGG